MKVPAGVSILIALIASSGLAAEPAQPPVELEEIVVVATRTPRPVSDIAGSVSVIDAERIANRLGIATPDLVAEDPAISLPRSGTRFGWGSYSIRGVGGDRVAIELDGVPIADHFQVGSFSNAGRDLVDISILERVEFLRGPASTLYGSDAIGGVVAYYTFDPRDVASPDNPWVTIRGGYRADTASTDTGLATALAGERLAGLVSITHRAGEQRDAAALEALPDDSQDWDSTSVFGKFTAETASGGLLTAVVDRFERDSTTDVQSVLGTGRFSSTTRLGGDDTEERDRLSLSYDFETPRSWLESGRIVAYTQDSDVRQDTLEERAASDIRRERRFEYRQDTAGLRFDAATTYTTPVVSHRVGYGVTLAETETTERRDALQTTLAGDNPTNVLLGEEFPVRDFPISDTREFGFYIHDEISPSGARWTLIPALRFDAYELDPRPDAVYLDDNPQADIVSVSERNVSPKLGFVYALEDGWRLFGQYARGFRAPPFEDVNIGLDIPLFNIRALPNPDLSSETSNGIELGIRQTRRGAYFSAAAHYTRYDDFIESRARIGADPATGTLLFQSRNIDEARIYGAELNWRGDITAWPAERGTLSATLALAWTRGKNTVTAQPLNAIDPAEAVVAFDWDAPQRPVSARLVWTLVADKSRVDDLGNTLFAPAGFGVVDAMARYRIGENAVIRAGVFNVTDKTYWRWASVNGRDTDDPALPYLSEPGRYAGASVEISW